MLSEIESIVNISINNMLFILWAVGQACQRVKNDLPLIEFKPKLLRTVKNG
jgi:hypothetical protein